MNPLIFPFYIIIKNYHGRFGLNNINSSIFNASKQYQIFRLGYYRKTIAIKILMVMKSA